MKYEEYLEMFIGESDVYSFFMKHDYFLTVDRSSFDSLLRNGEGLADPYGSLDFEENRNKAIADMEETKERINKMRMFI